MEDDVDLFEEVGEGLWSSPLMHHQSPFDDYEDLYKNVGYEDLYKDVCYEDNQDLYPTAGDGGHDVHHGPPWWPSGKVSAPTLGDMGIKSRLPWWSVSAIRWQCVAIGRVV